MQRRAAAVSVALFLLVAAGAYSLIGAAQSPDIQLENPNVQVGTNQTFTVADTEYTVTKIGDGSATAEWTNQSARYSQSWAAGDTVTYQGTDYAVEIANVSDPAEFTLSEVQQLGENVSTVEQNGTTYVVVERNGSTEFVPRDEYLPAPATHTFAEGDSIDYDNQTWTVGPVTNESVTLERFAPRTNEVSFAEGENTTLGGTPYLAHVTTVDGQPTLQLTTDYADYTNDVERQHYFTERMNGLWGVVILSGAAAALILMLAFLPPRY